jgi:predicted transcriptional regulator
MSTERLHPLIERLIDIQRSLGLSGSEMARRLEINPSSWTRLVGRDMQPSLRIVQSAVRAFPEVRSLCIELLLIRSIEVTDTHKPAEVA